MSRLCNIKKDVLGAIKPMIDMWLAGVTLQVNQIDGNGSNRWVDIEGDELPIEDMADFPQDYRIKPATTDKKTVKKYLLRQASSHWAVSKAMFEQLKYAGGFNVSGKLVKESAPGNPYDEDYYDDATIVFSDYGEFLRFIDTVGDIVIYRNRELDCLTIYDTYIE
jgi:hypothetical protein